MTGSRYEKAPEPSEAVAPLYEAMLKVLAGVMSVTEAAASVGLSRVRFQTRMHRGLAGLMAGLEEKPRGRRPTPEAEASLRAELRQLQQEKARLEAQVAATARMMGVASEWMRKGLAATPRQRRAKAPAEAPVSESEDDGPARRLEVVASLRAEGVPAVVVHALVAASAPTLRRWRRHREQGRPLRRKRGPRRGHGPHADGRARASEVLRAARGCIGAAALGRAAGLSRRVAAAVKADEATRREAERRAGATRVRVEPGVVRGFDAVDVGGAPVLVSADGGLPYRTSICVAARYDSDAVAAAVEADFERHGPPLVWRVDRWKAHVTPAVRAVLARHGVLLMHGPPHCPRFYGQLERQNREHRAWLDALGPCDAMQLKAECEAMREAFNELVPRRTLAWRTAGELWRARVEVTVDRRELQEEVEARRNKLVEQEALRVAYPGLVERLAIEAALTNRGLLRLTKGGWC